MRAGRPRGPRPPGEWPDSASLHRLILGVRFAELDVALVDVDLDAGAATVHVPAHLAGALDLHVPDLVGQVQGQARGHVDLDVQADLGVAPVLFGERVWALQLVRHDVRDLDDTVVGGDPDLGLLEPALPVARGTALGNAR